MRSGELDGERVSPETETCQDNEIWKRDESFGQRLPAFAMQRLFDILPRMADVPFCVP
jgi:hypothetical protein